VRKLLVAALAVAFAAATARTTTAAAPQAVRLDCATRVLAFVFLPGKRLVDVGDASHRRLLVADRRHYVWRSGCRRALGRAPLLRGAHVTTGKTARLGCVFPRSVVLVVEKRSSGVEVLAAPSGSARAALQANLGRKPLLEYDKRWCRAL
jgi:hypothetical protein